MYYDSLKARVRAARAAQERQKAAVSILDTLDVKEHIADVYHPLHDDIAALIHFACAIIVWRKLIQVHR